MRDGRGDKPLAIVNTAAGSGRAGARWPALARELERAGLACDVVFTDGEGAAARLATGAARIGRPAVLAVGGDGTVHEVVNGLMAAVEDGYTPPPLGVVPGGTAQDFARSAGIPLGARAAVAYLARAGPRPVDVGRIDFGDGGRCYFANYAGAGFDAMVAARAKAWGHALRGALPYVVGFFAVLRGYHNQQFVVRLDDDSPLVPARRINMVIVANGSSYAGVLRMAPHADLTDGLLDVTVVGDVGRLELLAHLPLAAFGGHLRHPKVTALRARAVAISARQSTLVQADGELVGVLPARFQVLPGALQLLQA